MSQRSGFGSGFLLGALFGGVVGGVAGAIAASRIKQQDRIGSDGEWIDGDDSLPFNTEENMEVARRSLENKIAQLNGAIDDVRQQMSVIHSTNGQEHSNS